MKAAIAILISFTALYVIFRIIEHKFRPSNYFFFCPTCFAFALTWNCLNILYFLGYEVDTFMLGALIAMSFVGSWYQFCYYFTKDRTFMNIGVCHIVTYFWFAWAIILISNISNKLIFEPMILAFDIIMIYILYKSPTIIKSLK